LEGRGECGVDDLEAETADLAVELLSDPRLRFPGSVAEWAEAHTTAVWHAGDVDHIQPVPVWCDAREGDLVRRDERHSGLRTAPRIGNDHVIVARVPTDKDVRDRTSSSGRPRSDACRVRGLSLKTSEPIEDSTRFLLPDKGKPSARAGRKATGLIELAGLPKEIVPVEGASGQAGRI
jgi:hypothetical protein